MPIRHTHSDIFQKGNFAKHFSGQLSVSFVMICDELMMEHIRNEVALLNISTGSEDCKDKSLSGSFHSIKPSIKMGVLLANVKMSCPSFVSPQEIPLLEQTIIDVDCCV